MDTYAGDPGEKFISHPFSEFIDETKISFLPCQESLERRRRKRDEGQGREVEGEERRAGERGIETCHY